MMFWAEDKSPSAHFAPVVLFAGMNVTVSLVPSRSTLWTRFSQDHRAPSDLPSRFWFWPRIARILREHYLDSTTLAQAELKIPQPDLPWIIGKAHATAVGDAVLFPVDEKAMEMAVRPPQDQLKDTVKIGDGGISADKKPTPDEGTDAAQSNLELVNTDVRRVEHERSLSDFLSLHLPRFFSDSPASIWSVRGACTPVRNARSWRAVARSCQSRRRYGRSRRKRKSDPPTTAPGNSVRCA